MVRKSSELIQLFVEFPSLSCFDRCLIICHFPSPGTFSMSPTGEQWKWPPKMEAASARVKGPDICPALTSTESSWSMISGCKSAEGRLPGMKDELRVGGLPIGEP